MTETMEWQQLLTRRRLGKNKLEDLDQGGRTCFQRDYDRLVFSSPFRRLKDKTQVFSLSKHDYVRTRLIHSLEVSCVGRSLGNLVGHEVIQRHSLKEFSASDFGDIVFAACLAHDIGNPPFGHTGEDALGVAFKSWYSDSQSSGRQYDLIDAQKEDLKNFEGNAQGFRLLARLEKATNDGGMQLTYPTLATFTKYPRESYIPKEILNNYTGNSTTKYGFFQSEKELFTEVAKTVGLIRRDQQVAWWARHPLAFLVEAADDICYNIVDLEDGHRMGYISYGEAQTLLNNIAQRSDMDQGTDSNEEKIKHLRAIVINKLVKEAYQIFLDHESEILAGTFDRDLMSLSSHISSLKAIKDKTRKKVYLNPEVISIQIGGYEVIDKLFKNFVKVSLYNSLEEADLKKKNDILKEMLPKKYHPIENESCYEKILKVTDYISGMTDSYATNLFQLLNSI